MPIKPWLVLAALTSLAAGRLAPATVFNVNSTQDLPDASVVNPVCAASAAGNPCTLRAAVMQANDHPGLDFISLPAGTYTFTREGNDDTASLGDLDVTDDLVVIGGPGVIINANDVDRAFDVFSSTLTLQSVVIENGLTDGFGGAVQALGDLSLLNSTIETSTAALDGGGLYVKHASLQMTDSLLRGNTSLAGGGGGVSVSGSNSHIDTYVVSGSTFAENQAPDGDGGGLQSSNARGVIQGSLFETNTAASQGGGLDFTSGLDDRTLNMGNTRVISNTATGSSGGGLYIAAQSTITHSQFISNVASFGGGVYNDVGTHNFVDVQISNNHAGICAGLQEFGGIVNLIRGQVFGNVSSGAGGGLCSAGPGTIYLSIADTVVYNNTADEGAGAFISNDFRSSGSALYGNLANTGAGLYIHGLGRIENSTISNNFARHDGGGIYAAPGAALHLNSATLAGNHAHTVLVGLGIGAGVYISATAAVSATNTLIGLNPISSVQSSYSDCFGALHSQGYNFISSKSGCTISGDTTGNQVGGLAPAFLDPKIEPLSWLGGLTPGHLPLAGSPLIDAGRPTGCTDADGQPLTVDQIDHDRALGGRCDIGAIERFDIQRMYLPSVRR